MEEVEAGQRDGWDNAEEWTTAGWSGGTEKGGKGGRRDESTPNISNHFHQTASKHKLDSNAKHHTHRERRAYTDKVQNKQNNQN